MTDKSTSTESQVLESLIAKWGYVMGSAGLRQALGFGSQQSLRLAIQADHLPFPVFTIEGRKGPFARTHDVATWLASLTPPSSVPHTSGTDSHHRAPAMRARKPRTP